MELRLWYCDDRTLLNRITGDAPGDLAVGRYTGAPLPIMRGEFVDIGGHRLYCYAAGSRGAGAPIILIHGAFTSSHLWKDLLPRLPKGHRILVLDLLGHGRSDPPRSAPMTVADHAERVCELMHIMGVTQATLVGHGMGAAIALHLRSMAPACATQVILVDPDLIAVAPAEPPESPGGRPAPHRCLSGRLRGRMRRIAMLEPVWRKLAPGWLASELHAAMLPAYALREVGVRALDSFLVNYRTREGREAVCAQLRALKRLPTTPTIVMPLSHESAITIASGMLASRRSQVCLTHLTDYLHQVTGTRVAIHQMAGVAHMAPEEAPDRLGSLISDVVRRQYKTESGVAILGDTATGIADVNSNNPPHSTQS